MTAAAWASSEESSTSINFEFRSVLFDAYISIVSSGFDQTERSSKDKSAAASKELATVDTKMPRQNQLFRVALFKRLRSVF
jgi:hypothetical protein